VANWRIFGSSHPGVFQAVLCDGSVHAISFSVNHEIHTWLGNRKDGQAIDGSAF
jgi:hypothetical protein